MIEVASPWTITFPSLVTARMKRPVSLRSTGAPPSPSPAGSVSNTTSVPPFSVESAARYSPSGESTGDPLSKVFSICWGSAPPRPHHQVLSSAFIASQVGPAVCRYHQVPGTCSPSTYSWSSSVYGIDGGSVDTTTGGAVDVVSLGVGDGGAGWGDVPPWVIATTAMTPSTTSSTAAAASTGSHGRRTTGSGRTGRAGTC